MSASIRLSQGKDQQGQISATTTVDNWLRSILCLRYRPNFFVVRLTIGIPLLPTATSYPPPPGPGRACKPTKLGRVGREEGVSVTIVRLRRAVLRDMLPVLRHVGQVCTCVHACARARVRACVFTRLRSVPRTRFMMK